MDKGIKYTAGRIEFVSRKRESRIHEESTQCLFQSNCFLGEMILRDKSEIM